MKLDGFGNQLSGFAHIATDRKATREVRNDGADAGRPLLEYDGVFHCSTYHKPLDNERLVFYM